MTVDLRPCHRCGNGPTAPRLLIQLALLWVAGLVVLPTPSLAQGGDDFERPRQIESLREAIHGHIAVRNYEEAILVADRLLALDPENSTATLWKNIAQRRLSPPPPSGRRNLVLDMTVRTPEPTPEPTPRRPSAATVPGTPGDVGDAGGAPAPIQPISPTPRPSAGGEFTLFGMSLLVLILVAVAVLLVLVALIAFIVLARSRRRVEDTAREVQGARADAGTGADDVTGHDAPTGADEVTGVSDAPTVSDSGDDVMAVLAAMPDEDSSPDEQTAVSDKNTEHEDTVVSFDDPTRQEADSQVNEVEETGGDTFGGEDPNEQSYSSLMFDLEETSVPGLKKEESQDDASFNSLMFDDDDTSDGDKGDTKPMFAPDEGNQDDIKLDDTVSLEGEDKTLPFSEDKKDDDDDSIKL